MMDVWSAYCHLGDPAETHCRVARVHGCEVEARAQTETGGIRGLQTPGTWSLRAVGRK